MEYFTSYTFMASLSAMIAIISLTLAIFAFVEHINIEKNEKDETLVTLPLLFKFLLYFTSNVAMVSNSGMLEGYVKKANNKLTMAGYDEETLTGEDFIAIRILFLIAGIFVLVFAFLIQNQLSGLVLLCLLYLYPILWLKRAISKRHLSIQKALPNVLDLLTLSVEAGKDFLTALKDILYRRKRDALGEELGRTFNEIQIGKQRRNALRDLADRVRQPDLTTVMNSIIQADELGVSIGKLLKVQGDQLRTKRFQRAEKLANEAPVKILLPIALFIFPPVLIILLGPMLMQAFTMFSQ